MVQEDCLQCRTTPPGSDPTPRRPAGARRRPRGPRPQPEPPASTEPLAAPGAAEPTPAASWLPSPSYTVDIMHVVMLLAVIILSIVVAGLGAKLSMLEMMLTAVLQNEATRR